MAQVVAGPAGFDMTELDLTTLISGALVSRTSTIYALDLGNGQAVTFTGVDFTYGAQNFPIGGAITGIQQTSFGQLVADITGLGVPVGTFYSWAINGQTLQGIEAMFAGSDSLTASNNPSGNVLGGFGGDDMLLGGVAGDVLDGGVGNNTIYGGEGNDTLGAPDSSGFNYIRGGLGGDAIFGGSGYDDINGNQGEDTIQGGEGGNDWLLGGQGNDQVTAFGGNVIINGNLGNDTVTGGPGNDTVRGGQAEDLVRGGAGDDHTYADRGNDTVTGGSGADVFHFSAAGGADWITDFDGAAGDRVQLDPGATYTLGQVGADAVITLSTGDTLALAGVASSAISPGWILT
jgi:Ca2+-binding RTX toxin-like protein